MSTNTNALGAAKDDASSKKRRKRVSRPPRPRLSDPPPRLGALPSDLFTSDQLKKIESLRAFIDAFPIEPSSPSSSSSISLPPKEEEKEEKSRPLDGDSNVSSSWFSWGGGGGSTSGESKKAEDSSASSVRALQWEEVLWLDDDLLLSRYLRSYNWDEEEAKAQLLKTLAWRRERKPQNVSPNEVMDTARKGSIYRKGFDRYGRAIIYFKPARDCGTSSKASQQYILYTVERALQSVSKCAGKDQLVFLLDFNGWGLSQLPATEVSREIVTILNYHYTDVLAHAFIIDAPSYFDAVWRLVCLMVHPETAKKVVFLSSRKPEDLKKLRDIVPEEYIEPSIGGKGSKATPAQSPLRAGEEEEEESEGEQEEDGEDDDDDDYNHEKYWRAEKCQFADVLLHRKKELERLQGEEALQKRVVRKENSKED